MLIQAERETTAKKLENAKREFTNTKSRISQAESWKFDIESAKCPTCGQRLPDGDIEKLKENFEKEKACRLADYNQIAESSKVLISGYTDSLKNLDAEIEKCKAEGKTKQDVYTQAVAEYKAYKELPADEPTNDIKVKEKELGEINSKMESLKSSGA